MKHFPSNLNTGAIPCPNFDLWIWSMNSIYSTLTLRFANYKSGEELEELNWKEIATESCNWLLWWKSMAYWLQNWQVGKKGETRFSYRFVLYNIFRICLYVFLSRGSTFASLKRRRRSPEKVWTVHYKKEMLYMHIDQNVSYNFYSSHVKMSQHPHITLQNPHHTGRHIHNDTFRHLSASYISDTSITKMSR